jgi:hypothetical protein
MTRFAPCSLPKAYGLAVLALAIASPALSQDVAKKSEATKRMAIAEERPEDARGWMIIAKQSYWPLCYEALDRIEGVQALVAAENDEELAEALEKSSAWMMLAASAAMTDGQSGVYSAADRFQEAADAIRSKTSTMTPEQYKDLATLGLLCIAKSHVIRADEPDATFKNPAVAPISKTRKNVPATVAEEEKQIRKEKILSQVEQYRYDSRQSRRHLIAAQEYLKAAAASGGFELQEELVATIPEQTDISVGNLVSYYDNEIRSRVKSIGDFVEAKRVALVRKLDEAL